MDYNRQRRPGGAGFLPRFFGYLTFSSPALIAGLLVGGMIGYRAGAGGSIHAPGASKLTQNDENPPAAPVPKVVADKPIKSAPPSSDDELIFAPPPRPVEKVTDRRRDDRFSADLFPPPTIRR